MYHLFYSIPFYILSTPFHLHSRKVDTPYLSRRFHTLLAAPMVRGLLLVQLPEEQQRFPRFGAPFHGLLQAPNGLAELPVVDVHLIGG